MQPSSDGHFYHEGQTSIDEVNFYMLEQPPHHRNETLFNSPLQQQNFESSSYNETLSNKQQNFRSSSQNDRAIHDAEIHPSDSNQTTKNSRERVNECIEKGNALRFRHPPVFKPPPKYDESLLKWIHESGSHFYGKSKLEDDVKEMPAIELLPKNQELGGYIFMANNDTYKEQTKSQIFGKLDFEMF
jgi:hypothetical protein